ncbi:MAG: glycosyltransferase [Mongoliitalea sp.]
MVYFSVIIPVFKDEKRLVLCLNAFQNMLIMDFSFEVIVVNNDSEDNKFEINISNYSFPIFIHHEKKQGSYAARNMGVNKSVGKIIAFTDSDMIPESNWLQTAYKYFSNDTDRAIGILTGPVPLFYKNPKRLTPAEVYEKYTGFDFAGYAKEGSCGAGNWFSYKNILEEFGGFREDLMSNGDTELSLRISKKYKVVYIPDLVNRHPARYTIEELVYRNQRILGGTYTRKYKGNYSGFLLHTLNFILRRYRFSLKKFFTIPIQESWAIFIVCNSLSWGALKECYALLNGRETKR